jgi:hypothetical protein
MRQSKDRNCYALIINARSGRFQKGQENLNKDQAEQDQRVMQFNQCPAQFD